MQRLFTAFPGGRPGSGLLLLRVVVGLVGAGHAVLTLAATPAAPASWLAIAIDCVAIASGVAVVAGLVTPAAAIVLALATQLSWSSTPLEAMHCNRSSGVLLFAIAAAIALVGPGAFSIDAFLFGRREVVIPRTRRPAP